ncbi:MAG: NAD(+) synthase, partial [Thermoplasmata archaeon]
MDIDLSINLDEVSTVIKDFIRTYVENSSCKGVVIGLSGGVDSAVTAVLCKQALKKKNVNCLFLLDETTPEVDYKHCRLVVKKFDLQCEEKNITSVVKEVSNVCVVKPDKYALAN